MKRLFGVLVIAFAMFVAALFINCGSLPPINLCDLVVCGPEYHCVGGKCVPNEPPPPVCPESCDHGLQCTNPAVGCEPIPAPGPICMPGMICGCYIFPPTAPNWVHLVCPEGQECTTNGNCIVIPSPPPVDCQSTGCPKGQVCQEGIGVWTCVVPLNGCSATPSDEATLCINDKAAGHGYDSSLRVKGDPAFCQIVTGQVGVNDCSLEGLPDRAECEMYLMGGCPIWQYRKVGEDTIYPCHDDQEAWASCDHFGSPSARDDPQTHDVFEGKPAECGFQRWNGKPDAGFFTVAHGTGQIRACFANDPKNCGPWKAFDH